MSLQPMEATEQNNKDGVSRRDMFAKIGLLLNGLAVAILATPVVGYMLSPILRSERGRYKSWVSLGELDVRRVAGEQFQVFAINCAHLGCPVRWFAQSGLFMCPCHGGVYYADGSRASGPPPRGLFEYAYKVENGKLLIEAGQLPTLSTTATLETVRRGCQG